MPSVTSVVLVHGAWADGSTWAKIIPVLKARGLQVSAVQLPLVSLALDVTATNRIIDAQDGQVLLVAHAYGGAVITEAGTNPKVEGLVYVAAVGPEAGETATTMSANYPPPDAFQEIRPVGDGYILLSEKGIKEYFAQDLPSDEIDLLVSTQGQTNKAIFDTPLQSTAWKSKPCWYIISSNDKTLQPAQQRDAAKRMNAQILTLATSHVPMLLEPEKVGEFIIEAVKHLNK